MLIAAGDRTKYTNIVGATPACRGDDLFAISGANFL
jgi:hypothetical protein